MDAQLASFWVTDSDHDAYETPNWSDFLLFLISSSPTCILVRTLHRGIWMCYTFMQSPCTFGVSSCVLACSIAWHGVVSEQDMKLFCRHSGRALAHHCWCWNSQTVFPSHGSTNVKCVSNQLWKLVSITRLPPSEKFEDLHVQLRPPLFFFLFWYYQWPA